MRKRMTVSLVACLTFLLCGLASTLEVCGAVIDFEDLSTGGLQYVDLPQASLNYNNVDGSGVDVTITQGADFLLFNLALYGTWAPYGNALLDYHFPSGPSNTNGTTINFSKLVSDFSLIAGDFSGDNDQFVQIKLFDSSNSLVDTISAPWDENATAPFATLSGSYGDGISKIVYSSGGIYYGSTFIDNLTFTAKSTTHNEVPEPSTLLLIGSGLIGLVGYGRKKFFKK